MKYSFTDLQRRKKIAGGIKAFLGGMIIASILQAIIPHLRCYSLESGFFYFLVIVFAISGAAESRYDRKIKEFIKNREADLETKRQEKAKGEQEIQTLSTVVGELVDRLEVLESSQINEFIKAHLEECYPDVQYKISTGTIFRYLNNAENCLVSYINDEDLNLDEVDFYHTAILVNNIASLKDKIILIDFYFSINGEHDYITIISSDTLKKMQDL